MESPPVFKVIDDGHGNLVFQQTPPSFTDDPDRVFNNVAEGFNTAVKWGVVASVVSGVVLTIAIVAIAYAIIDCLKRTGRSNPSYTQLATSDTDKSNSTSSNDISITIPGVIPTAPDSQLEFPTMEMFLSNMARERPIRFSPQQIARYTDDYGTVLGSGGFGVVFKGELPNGIQVAVKVLNNNLEKQVEQQFMAEVSTIGRTYHINLVKLYGFCFTSSLKALVYEYMENGSLDTFLFSKTRQVEYDKLNRIAIGTAKGLAYLHEECQKRIIHYDIKPGNVLLDKNMNPKVADFGLAKLCNIESTRVLLSDRRGTPGYAAPELWKPYPMTHKCDVYSFGMLLFEVVGRRRNYDDNILESRQWLPRWTWDVYNNGEIESMLRMCGIEEKDVKKGEKMLMVALWCVQYSAEVRPTMSTVVKMLEGDVEVPPPPFPFEYAESPGKCSEDSSFSSSIETDASQQSCSKPLMGALEIEIVSSTEI